MKRFLITLVAALFMSQLSYANERSPEGTITRLITYSEYGAGDVFVSLNNNGTACSYGYYVSKTHPGYEVVVSSLIAAYHTQAKLYIRGLPDKKWTGSTNDVCQIYAVVYGNQ